jgi:hypothetical protein
MSHEGHPTEDLADTGSRARVMLGQKLKTMNEEMRRLEGVREAIRLKGAQLQELRVTTERDIQQRIDALNSQVKEIGDKTFMTFEAVNAELVASLTDTQTHVQHLQAALTSRSEHVTCVLQEEKAADLIALEDQLKDFSVDRQEVEQVLRQVESLSKPYVCDFNATSINLALSAAQEYIELLKKTSDEGSQTQTRNSALTKRPCIAEEMHSAPAQKKSTPAQGLQSAGSAANPASSTVSPAVSAKVVLKCFQLKYWEDPQSDVIYICVTTEKRASILCETSSKDTTLCQQGLSGVLTKMTLKHKHAILGKKHKFDAMISGSDGVTLCFYQYDIYSFSLVSTSPQDGQWVLGRCYMISGLCVPKCLIGNDFYASGTNGMGHYLVKVAVNSGNPVRLHSSFEKCCLAI